MQLYIQFGFLVTILLTAATVISFTKVKSLAAHFLLRIPVCIYGAVIIFLLPNYFTEHLLDTVAKAGGNLLGANFIMWAMSTYESGLWFSAISTVVLAAALSIIVFKQRKLPELRFITATATAVAQLFIIVMSFIISLGTANRSFDIGIYICLNSLYLAALLNIFPFLSLLIPRLANRKNLDNAV